MSSRQCAVDNILLKIKEDFIRLGKNSAQELKPTIISLAKLTSICLLPVAIYSSILVFKTIKSLLICSILSCNSLL